MKLPILASTLALIAGFSCAQPANAAPATPKYALLVGITDYSRDGLPKLDGCLNDVRDMRQSLIDNFGYKPENIRVLTNKDATRDGIAKAFRSQIGANAALAPNGNFLFYYSGHGFQVNDANGDEKLEDPNDTKDETFMAWDKDLVDDDVDTLCRETRGVKNFTGALTVILDSCHSGTATRGAAQAGMPKAKSAQASYEAPPEVPLQETKSKGSPNAGSLVAFSGCLSTQSSEEKLFPIAPKAGEKGATKNEFHGVLTYYLLQAMKNATQSTSNSQMWTQVATVLSGKYDQLPLLEGSRPNAPFLGGATRDTITPIPYTLAGNTLTFNKGIEAGAVKGGFIKVSSAGQPEKQLAIATASLGRATATLPKDATIGNTGTVELLTPYFGSEALKVGLGTGIAANNPVLARLQGHYSGDKSSFVTLATAGEAPNVYLLRSTRGQALPKFVEKENAPEKASDAGYIFSKAPNGQAIFGAWMPVNEGDDINAQEEIRLFQTLDNYAAQSNVKTLSNQIQSGLTAKEAVKITTYVVQGTTNAAGKWSPNPANRKGTEVDFSKRKFSPGERFRIEFKNLTAQPVYVSLVWLSGDGSITVLQDTKNRRQIVLAPKDEAEDTAATGYYNITGPATEETIKFFISRQPVDVNYLDRDAITGTRDGAVAGLSAFNLIAGQMMGTRGAPQPELDQPEFESWDTFSVPLSIVDADGNGKGFIDVSK